jgi:hypothetical protein
MSSASLIGLVNCTSLGSSLNVEAGLMYRKVQMEAGYGKK